MSLGKLSRASASAAGAGANLGLHRQRYTLVAAPLTQLQQQQQQQQQQLHQRLSSSSKRTLSSSSTASAASSSSSSTANASTLGPHDVALRFVSAPVLLEDVEQFKGSGSKSAPPGSAGLYDVVSVGARVKNFAAGDRVAACKPFPSGNWKLEASAPESSLAKLPKGFDHPVDLYAHAQAIKLLEGVKEGSVVAVNGAQYSLGFAFAMIGKERNLRVVALVGANAKGMDQIAVVRAAGAEIVAPEGFDGGETYSGSWNFRRLVSDLPPAVLAVNQKLFIFKKYCCRLFTLRMDHTIIVTMVS